MSIAAGVGALATLVASIGIERLAASVPARIALTALPARAACVAMLWLGWLGVFGRPFLATAAVLITLSTLAAISIKKRHLVGEPLVFSDFGLIRLVLRHPDLYYIDLWRSPLVLAGFGLSLVVLVTWIRIEPALVGIEGAAGLLILVAITTAGAWWAARRPPVADALARLMPGPDLERHVAAWGLLLTLVAYALRWRGETGRTWPVAAGGPGGSLPGGEGEIDLVVVVQLESFLDPGRRDGSPPLPGLTAARERAFAYGPLSVPAHGAYTMRSEFAVLSGLSGDDLGFRRFDPFLSVLARGAPLPDTLVGDLAGRGWRTVFLHPFRPGFFDRERVMKQLGFARLLWEDDLAGDERRGPYLGDEALARRILSEVAGVGGPALVMAVTMENHGPWGPGRLPDEDDAVAQYRFHLEGADRAIAVLVDGLSRRPGRALLCLYGDHPPILPGFDAGAPPETDYLVLELGGDVEAAEPRKMPLSADALGRLVRRLARPAPGAALPA